MNIPEKDWMPINTMPEAKPEPPRVYPVGPQDRELARRTPAREGPFEKGRVVLDIRGLNKVTVPDGYPMPLQSGIISSVTGCPYVSVMDAAGFFQQWLVKLPDRHKLIVVSHRDSEQWNVAVMGFRNSPAYMQRQWISYSGNIARSLAHM